MIFVYQVILLQDPAPPRAIELLPMSVIKKMHQVHLFARALQVRNRVEEVMTVPNSLPSRAGMKEFAVVHAAPEHVEDKACFLFGALISDSVNELTFLASTCGPWHQFNSNRNPPIWGAAKKETWFSSNSSGVIQHDCGTARCVTAQLRSSMAVAGVTTTCSYTLLSALLCTCLPHSACSALARCLSYGKCSLLFSVEGESVLPEPRAVDLQREMPHPWPLTGLSCANEDSSSSQFGSHCPDWL